MKLLAAKPAAVRRSMNLWPPFVFSGIRITDLPPDFMSVTVRLRLRWWNRNVAGVHFGGSLFAMTDPFWMMLLLRHLGKEHIIWDRAAEVDFVKPGKGDVYARFRINEDDLVRLWGEAAGGAKVLEWFTVEVVDAGGDVVARVRKQVYLRRKREIPAKAAATAFPPRRAAR